MARPTIDAYIAAWNHYAEADLAGMFAGGGTYEDPSTGGPIAATALAEVVARLRESFPDLVFAATAVTQAADRTILEWTMRGHLRGPLFGAPATDRLVELAGVDILELGDDGLRAVRRHYDARALAERAGLTVLVLPADGERAHHGYSTRIASGNPRPPGIIALTWIAGADEAEKSRIRAHARENVQDFLAEPGFIAIVTGFAGLRGFTATAWEDEASMRRALSGHHAAAMHELRTERFVASVWTSVWQPVRVGRLWLRCAACGHLEDVSDDHRECTACAAPLPPRPAYW